MDKHIYKSHNKTLLLYHMVFPAKYRKKIFDDAVDKTLKDVCLELVKDMKYIFWKLQGSVRNSASV